MLKKRSSWHSSEGVKSRFVKSTTQHVPGAVAFADKQDATLLVSYNSFDTHTVKAGFVHGYMISEKTGFSRVINNGIVFA
jgi:hypothetical protein